MSATNSLQTMRQHLRDQMGGSMTEFAVGTLVLVPVVLYGIWFSDAMHFAVVAEEASIEPAFDSTAHLIHAYEGGSASSRLSGAASSSSSNVSSELSSSFDSFDKNANTYSSSVVAHPSNLQVTCKASGGSGQSPGGTPAISNAGASLLPTNTWVTCNSSVEIDTVGVPTQFMQDHAHADLFPANRRTFKLCGAGPGITGCGSGSGSNNIGFSIMLDDWGLDDGAANKLSIGSASGNQGYFAVGNQFFKNMGNGAILMAMGAVTQIPQDLGSTANFRLTYEVDSSGSYNQTESAHGQGGPLGGPGNPHTGGPWHDEHSQHSDMDKTVFSQRTNDHYLARQDYPAD